MVENTEYPFATLDSFITPTDEFYVRNHFAYPQLDTNRWQLRVEGKVENPYTLTYAELLRLPSKTQTVTLECAGNHRAFLKPAVGGLQWGSGAVSNAEWTGVPLSSVLERAGLKADALEVIVEGADCGEVTTSPKPAGAIHFARSLPLDHPILADSLLAYQMNGETLTTAHGYPLRLIVPSWYAMASVKWVQRLLVTSKKFHGYFQSTDYAFWTQVDGVPTRLPITTMQPKAAIARPTVDEVLPRNKAFCIHGAAWGGDAAIATVEVSTDGGESWNKARLLGESVAYAWRLWHFDAPAISQPGRHILMAKATDCRGRTQAIQRDANLENYMISHVIPIPVTIC